MRAAFNGYAEMTVRLKVDEWRYVIVVGSDGVADIEHRWARIGRHWIKVEDGKCVGDWL